MGMTKAQMDSVVGIHPTCAEDCIGLHLTKEENPDAKFGEMAKLLSAEYKNLGKEELAELDKKVRFLTVAIARALFTKRQSPHSLFFFYKLRFLG